MVFDKNQENRKSVEQKVDQEEEKPVVNDKSDKKNKESDKFLNAANLNKNDQIEVAKYQDVIQATNPEGSVSSKDKPLVINYDDNDALLEAQQCSPFIFSNHGSIRSCNKSNLDKAGGDDDDLFKPTS